MTSIFKSWKSGSILITDAGWGDSGKGKVVSSLIPDIAAKVIGGHNAGHTVVTDKGELGLGLIPSSVIYPKVKSVIGQEVVIDPMFLINEIATIRKFGIKVTPTTLTIDPRSHLVLPWHIIRDKLSEEWREAAKVGSLHLGVGWTYSDRLNRRGLRILDILEDDWQKRVKEEYQNQLGVIEGLRTEVKLRLGVKSQVDSSLNLRKIYEIIRQTRKILKPFLGNTTEIIWQAIDKNKKILFEDSHGTMLDVSHGSWPYTTIVNTGMGGVYRSFGGRAVKSIVKTIVCTKAYQTRVGGCPMPTEDMGKLGEFLQVNGHEVGTRSGRKRRCGPIDIPLLRYAYQALGLTQNDEVAITKLDVFTGLKKIPICTDYKYKGKVYGEAPSTDASFLTKVKTVNKTLPGWEEKIEDVRKFSNLPKAAQNYIIEVEKNLKVPITFIGVGKHKDAKIFK